MFLRLMSLCAALCFAALVFTTVRAPEELAQPHSGSSVFSKEVAVGRVGEHPPKQVALTVEKSECKSFIELGVNKICLPPNVPRNDRENLNPESKIPLHERTSFQDISDPRNSDKNIPVLIQGPAVEESSKTGVLKEVTSPAVTRFFFKSCGTSC